MHHKATPAQHLQGPMLPLLLPRLPLQGAPLVLCGCVESSWRACSGDADVTLAMPAVKAVCTAWNCAAVLEKFATRTTAADGSVVGAKPAAGVTPGREAARGLRHSQQCRLALMVTCLWGSARLIFCDVQHLQCQPCVHYQHGTMGCAAQKSLGCALSFQGLCGRRCWQRWCSCSDRWP
jgi:hypothetical protein